MDDKLVTVLFFDNVQQAYILQAELDSFGIPLILPMNLCHKCMLSRTQ